MQSIKNVLFDNLKIKQAFHFGSTAKVKTKSMYFENIKDTFLFSFVATFWLNEEASNRKWGLWGHEIRYYTEEGAGLLLLDTN